MKRVLSTLVAIVLLAGLAGCRSLPTTWIPAGGHGCGGCGSCGGECEPCDSFCGKCCGGGGGCGGSCESCCGGDCEPCDTGGCRSSCPRDAILCGLLGRCCCTHVADPPPVTPGPPTGAITYPYYTIRGPRDFLAESPPSIGP